MIKKCELNGQKIKVKYSRQFKAAAVTAISVTITGSQFKGNHKSASILQRVLNVFARIKGIKCLVFRNILEAKQVAAACFNNKEMFWLYEIQRRTRDGYEGTWMNKVGERTYVRGSKKILLVSEILFTFVI